MDKAELLELILDNMHKPLVFVDADHVIRYMNDPAKKHYAKWGDAVGKSIFHCHNETSAAVIREAYAALQNGAREVLIVDKEKHRVYMRAAYDGQGRLAGYFERYAPGLGK